jgi:hypothetical protein
MATIYTKEHGMMKVLVSQIHSQKHTLHRVDGPAVEYSSEGYSSRVECWYLNGSLHREDGPAIETGKREFWYFHGHQHRLGGPAVVKRHFPNDNEYWINDVQVTSELHDTICRLIASMPLELRMTDPARWIREFK